MFKRIVMCFALIPLIFGFGVVAAQDKSLLRTSIVDSIKSHEAEWRLEYAEQAPFIEDLKFDALFFKWAREKDVIESVVLLHDTAEEAAATYQNLVKQEVIFNVRKKELKAKAGKMGEESYSWEGINTSEGFYGYVIRKRNAVIYVSSSSVETATRCAVHVVDIIQS